MCNSTRGDEPLYTQSYKFYLSWPWTTCPDHAWLPWSRHSYCRGISPNTWCWRPEIPLTAPLTASHLFSRSPLRRYTITAVHVCLPPVQVCIMIFKNTRTLEDNLGKRANFKGKFNSELCEQPRRKMTLPRVIYWLPSESKWKTHRLHGHNFSINHVTSCIHLALTQKWFQWAKIKCYLSSNAEVLLIILITCKLHLYNSKYIITWECQ